MIINKKSKKRQKKSKNKERHITGQLQEAQGTKKRKLDDAATEDAPEPATKKKKSDRNRYVTKF